MQYIFLKILRNNKYRNTKLIFQEVFIMSKNQNMRNENTSNCTRNETENTTNCDKYRNSTQNRTSQSNKAGTEKNVESQKNY